MDAKELRIGNFINKLGSPIKVTNETFRNVEAMMFPYQPIELTEEWLLKFNNAEIKPFGLGVEVLERFIFIWKESYNYWYVVTKESKEYLTKIEFLHEYQNFIFSLTGEELTTK